MSIYTKVLMNISSTTKNAFQITRNSKQAVLAQVPDCVLLDTLYLSCSLNSYFNWIFSESENMKKFIQSKIIKFL